MADKKETKEVVAEVAEVASETKSEAYIELEKTFALYKEQNPVKYEKKAESFAKQLSELK